MSYPILSLEEITLKFGGAPLFDGLNLHILNDDKICLVGKNGAGKTSLIRVMMGELELDQGTRFVLPGARLRYLEQAPEFDPSETVFSYVQQGLPDDEKSEIFHHRVYSMLEPLTLSATAKMGTLSGGQIRRAGLARALCETPDLLLLDEPTNHLDISAIEWLENYLASYRGALMVISHDRAFLASISRKVFWLDRGAIRVCPRGYKEFDAWVESEMEHEARALRNLQKKLQIEESWMQGGVTARRKRNQRRLSELHRLREKMQNDKAAMRARLAKIELEPMTPTHASKRVAEFKNVCKSFDDNGASKPILENLNLRIFRGDRIGILGKNGSGKSTFLKLLVDEIQPDRGHITRGKSIEISYFDQQRSSLDPEDSLWEALCPQGGDHVFIQRGEEKVPRHVCAYLKDFLFDPKIARDKIATLSGGQRHRLMLAKVMLSPGNVLVLDEPTNDLDMDTLDMLQDLLTDYAGTLIIVSHDRDFLDKTVTQIFAFEGDGVVDGYIGGYADYIRQRNTRYNSNSASSNSNSKAAKSANENSQKPAKTNISFKLKHEFSTLPEKISAMETEISELEKLLSDPNFYTRDPEKFDQAATRLPQLRETLSAAENRWLELDALMG